jgi:hypothetical protein
MPDANRDSSRPDAPSPRRRPSTPPACGRPSTAAVHASAAHDEQRSKTFHRVNKWVKRRVSNVAEIYKSDPLQSRIKSKSKLNF